MSSCKYLDEELETLPDGNSDELIHIYESGQKIGKRQVLSPPIRLVECTSHQPQMCTGYGCQ